jgi:hypothetical protein
MQPILTPFGSDELVGPLARRTGNLWSECSSRTESLVTVPGMSLLSPQPAMPVRASHVMHLQERFDALLDVHDDFRTIVHRLLGAGLGAVVVGGWARDVLVGRAPHDIDMVVVGAGSGQLEVILPPAARKTALGGVAFECGGLEIDLWSLEATYLVRQFSLEPTLEVLMRVIDFNINTILFTPRQFAREPHALEAGVLDAFERREIDFNCGVLALPVAQVSRLAYFAAKLGFVLAPRVKRFMRQQCVERALRTDVEENLRHYCPLRYLEATLDALDNAVCGRS